MATYWAELNTKKIVQQVITGVDDATIDGIATANWYTDFVGAPCVQTYKDDPTKTFAGIGFIYDSTTQNFINPNAKVYPIEH
jgi:hypothetical protein